MKLTTSAGANINYIAKVVKIKSLRPHPNADRLMVTTIDGNNLITAKGGISEGDLVVVFPIECAISHVLLGPSNSYKDNTLNSDTKQTGFFESTGRVKALRLRGEKSEGYMLPVEIVAEAFGVDNDFSNYEGVEFDTINGVTFVKKYVVKKFNESGTSVKKTPALKRELLEAKLIENQFRFHDSTSHLGKNLFKISPNTLIAVTWKLHGTSGVFSNILVKRKLKWYERALKSLGILIQETKHELIYSSRKVIKNDDLTLTHNSYHDKDLWSSVARDLEGVLNPGETLYAEICGYDTSGKIIQHGYDFFKEPKLDKPYEVFVYRITNTTPEGRVIEMSYDQLAERCEQIGIKSVPLIHSGKAKYLYPFEGDIENPRDVSDWRDNFLSFLKNKYVYDQNTIFSKNKAPEEGIVIRLEKLKLEALKLKSFKFAEMESKQKDAGQVDIEDIESNPSE